MKRFILLAAVALAFASCEDKKAATAKAEAQPAATTTTQESPSNPTVGINIGNQTIPGTAIIGNPGDPISPQTEQVIAGMTNGFWQFLAFIKINDTPERAAAFQNVGYWYDFKKDGTYLSGQWTEQKGGGKWTFNPKLARVHIMPNGNDRQKMELNTKMSSDSKIMIWTGSSRYMQTGINAKLENFLEPLPLESLLSPTEVENYSKGLEIYEKSLK